MLQNVNKGLIAQTAPLSVDPNPAPIWRWISERGLLVTTGEATLARYGALTSGVFPEIEDIIPADGSLLLILRRGAVASAELQAALAAPLTHIRAVIGAHHEITVDYGGDAGPDLPALAAQAGLAQGAYINRHAAVEYTVAFLGFQPGFPYLRGLPQALHAPRRATPRVRVEVGSVALGGGYTGIYPASGPGGWQVIGRTSAAIFNPHRVAPALLMPGDRVRFVPR